MQILIVRVFHFYGVVILAAAVTAVLMELYEHHAMQLEIKFTWQHVFATAIAYSAAVSMLLLLVL